MKKPEYVSTPTYIAVLETRIKALEHQLATVSCNFWTHDPCANAWLKKWPKIKLAAYPPKRRKK